MSTISVLAFPSDTPVPLTGRDNYDSELTFNSHDWAFQIESPQHKYINIKKPYSVIYTPQNPEPVPINTYPRQPILKIRIATAKHSNLLKDVSTSLKGVPSDTKNEHWLDAALTELQKKFIVQPFSINTFHQFVLDSLSKMPSATFRRMSTGTTELDYLSMLGNSAEVKKMLAPAHGNGANGAAPATAPASATPDAPIAASCKSLSLFVLSCN